MTHPVSLHSLDELNSSESDSFGHASKIKGLAVAVNVKGRIDKWQLTLEIKEFEQFKEASSQLEQIHIHFIAEVDEQIRSFNRAKSNIKGSSCIGLDSFALIKEPETIGISNDAHSGNQSELSISYASSSSNSILRR